MLHDKKSDAHFYTAPLNMNMMQDKA